MDENKAIPFILFDKTNNSFYVTDESKIFLSTLSNNVAIFSIVGKYRTGKSFLLNKILGNNKKSCFQVDSTINSCTKGLWIWSKTIQKDGLDILVIDTEGFGSTEEGSNHDNKIFLFTVLLSSLFIYNTTNKIDETNLSNLGLIIEYAKNIQTKSNQNKINDNEVSNNFPYLIWALRDFSLKIVDENKNPQTPTQYLENNLKESNNVNDDQKNRNRKLIKHYFKERECVTFPLPYNDSSDAKNLNELKDKFINFKFLNQVDELKKKIFKNIKPKKINNKFMNGTIFSQSTEFYVDCINNNCIPNTENAWVYVMKKENTKAYSSSIGLWNNYFSKNLTMNKMDNNWKSDLINTILNNFKKNCIGEEYHDFENKLITETNTKIEKNIEKMKYEENEKLDEEFKSKYIEIKDKLNDIEFDDDHELFRMLENIRKELAPIYDYNNLESLINSKKIEILEKINSRLKNNGNLKIKNLKIKNKEIKNKLLNLENDLSSIKNQNNQLTNDKHLLNEKWKLYDNRDTGFQHNLENNDKLKILNDENQNYMLEIHQLKEEIENLKNDKNVKFEEKLENNNNSDRLLELNKIIEEKDIIIENNNKILNEKNSIVNDIEKSLLLKENEIQQINSEFNKKFEDIENINKNNKNEITQLNVELSTKDIKIQSLLNEIQDISKLNEIKINNLKESLKHTDEIEDYKIQLECNETQINILTKQLEDNKNYNHNLITSIKNLKNDNNINQENNVIKNLSYTNKKNSIKIKQLEEKIEKYRNYKTMCKNTIKFQCSVCQNFYTFPNYFNHLSNCYEEETIKDKIFSIYSSYEVDNSGYINYIFNINNNGKKFCLKKNLKDFSNLHYLLKEKFPYINLKESNIFNNKDDLTNYASRNENIDDRKNKIKNYLNNLFNNNKINKSIIFNNFIGNHEDDYQSYNSEFTEENINISNDFWLKENKTENEDKINKLMKNLKSENFEFNFFKKDDKKIL